ncbi:hypothetical protein CRUP_007654 [Coryphaenoides rupestris]|nr:hypothetical protein CRUP_007654 [Coryphaenoides rupestris]
MKSLHASMAELQAENQAMQQRLEATQKELKTQQGVFTAPVRGVYYIRFTANSPTDNTMSAVLYKNNVSIQLIVHEQPSGEGSDTAANGAALLLEEGDTLKMVLWPNTQIWDNSNHHSTFSGFLVFPMGS